MIRKIKNIIWQILIKFGIGGPIQLMLNGQLLDDGWFKSFNTKRSIDKNGNPIPWCTYPFIKFIEPRLKKNFDVFEFGGGSSTIWYAERVRSIKSVEHNKSWIDFISVKLPANAKMVFRELSPNGDYSKEVSRDDKKYQIIIIDGRDRNNCAINSLNSLSEDGVIIFDNTDRTQYNKSIEVLLEKDFKRIDFFGMSPVTPHTSCTSIFYRNNNCLGI